jgi:DNA-binding response OmpR family regulator
MMPDPPLDEVRVLVADDDVDVADSLAEILKRNGYKVFVAHDGVSALALVDEIRPHCVLVDVRMPNLTGDEFIRRVRSSHQDDIVLIAITGYSREKPDVSNAFEHADHYLTKPVDPAALRKLLPPL